MAVWGALIGAGLNYATQSGSSGQPSQMADPFAAQRPQYMQQLQQMMTGGFTPTDPSYGFRMSQGTENLNRGLAASGQMGSGAQMAQLQQYGQGMASQEYGKQFDRLSLLSGAQSGSPAGAGQLLYQQQSDQAKGAGILGSAAYDALKGYYGQPKPQQQSSMPAGYASDQYGYAVNPSGETLSY